jgi:DNA-binding transcriptional LysR family regulator
VANGWEAEIRIAVDAIVPVALLHPLLARFFDDCGRLGGAAPRTATRVRIEAEALGGTWESVIAGRVDLAVGASGDPPPGANLRTRPLGTIEEVFVVAAGHPLATAAEPLPPVAIARHRAVAVADSARSTPPRTLGLLPSQDTLTVPDIGTKLDALLAGLGCGYLPRYVVIPALGDSRLVEKRIAEPKPEATLALAWRARRPGRALTWWLDALSQPQDWGGRVFARRNA